ncbi:reverse transcriptase [Lasius niger]|uniref:Reverse transcriptase n=1 Tax=Lasius niger TaxID=67767 RepID=A0A0J7K4D2_LASNI|nr:reverse transcriptase [Lasius niger]
MRKRNFPKYLRAITVDYLHKRYLVFVGPADVDRSWSFREHFRRMATREEASASLGRLMPNLCGPHERKRRLYSMVVHSMMLYGAPVWAEALACDSRKNRDLLKRSQRTVVQRVAEVLRLVFLKMKQEQAEGGELDPVAIREYSARVTCDMVAKWKERVKDFRLLGHRVREALGPVLEEGIFVSTVI